MKLFKKIIVFFLIPYPSAILGAFAFASLVTSFFEGRISEWPTSALQEAQAPPGYLVCGLIVLVVQFFLGALPIFFLRKFKSGLVGFLLTGLTVASLSAAMMVGGDASKEFNLFVLMLFFLIIAGYFLSYTLLDVKSNSTRQAF
jgi:hypothetical protein